MRLIRSRKVWYWTAVAVIAAAVWVARESCCIEVRTVDIRLPHFDPADDGFSVALVSDQHFGPHDRGRARRIAETANSLKPDVILLLGDHVFDSSLTEVSHPRSTAITAAVISSILPVRKSFLSLISGTVSTGTAFPSFSGSIGMRKA